MITRPPFSRVWVPALAFLLLIGSAKAREGIEPETRPDRPRTVLVLSGGGARGMAHIGVLEVLEELNVPFDAIVGSSMGAIVGGLYAAGFSPDELRRELQRIDWQAAFNDSPPRKSISFRRKEDDLVTLVNIEAGFNKQRGLSIPSGIVAGQKLNFILRSLLLNTASISSFDDLPIPFRAIATDLDSGEAVVIGRGDLPNAIRASMAFPVLFTPVNFDGKLLIDGGVVRNLPLDVALEMGAERIIAVDVGSRLSGMKTDAPSAMQVLRRASSIQSKAVREEVLELLREQDVLIKPDLDGVITFSDFDQIRPAVARGREAAAAERERLSEFAVTPDAYEPFLQRQRRGIQTAPIRIDEITVEGLERVPQARILRRIGTRPGDMLDLQTLQDDLERVYLIGEFETVEFRIEPEGEGARLVIEAREKSWGPWYLRAGLALETNFSGTGDFLLNILLRRSEINRLGAEWRTLLTIGSNDILATDFYQPLSQAGTWFVGPSLFLSQNDDERLVAGNQEFLAESKIGWLELDVGRALVPWGEIRLGGYYGAADTRVRLPVEEEADESIGGYQLKFSIDTLDKAFFPRQGTWMRLIGRLSRDEMGAEREYERVGFVLNSAFSSGKNTWIWRMRLGGDFGSNLPFYDDFEIGGFLNLSGLRRNELRGQAVGFGALIYYRRLNKSRGPFGTNFYVGGSLEAGNAWLDPEPVTFGSLRPAGSVFFGASTFFGPVYFAFGKTEGTQGTAYLLLGRIF